jgi:hypothetical protein
MIAKKLVFIDIKNEEKFEPENFDIDDIKHIAVKNTKKYGFKIFVAFLRFYIKFSYVLKNKYKRLKKIIKYIISNYFTHKDKKIKEKEVSNFLKRISEYKYKISKIKDKIKEEEGIK